MKRVIVACGGAIATSTIAGQKVKELAEKNNIPVEIVQCRISEIDAFLNNIDLIITTSKVKKEYDIPLLHGMPFVSGIGIEELEDKIIKILKKEEN